MPLPSTISKQECLPHPLSFLLYPHLCPQRHTAIGITQLFTKDLYLASLLLTLSYAPEPSLVQMQEESDWWYTYIIISLSPLTKKMQHLWPLCLMCTEAWPATASAKLSLVSLSLFHWWFTHFWGPVKIMGDQWSFWEFPALHTHTHTYARMHTHRHAVDRNTLSVICLSA